MRIALCLAVLALSGAAAAAPGTHAAPAPPAAGHVAGPPPATLEIAGREIAKLHATVGGRAPAERAENARRHLISAYERNRSPVVSVRAAGGGAQVLADGKVVFTVAEGDVDAADGETPAEVAGIAVGRVRRILEEIEERGDPREVMKGLGLAVAASLFAFLLLRGVLALDGSVGRWAARKASAKAQQVRLGGVHVLDERAAIRAVRLAVRLAMWASVLVLAFLWLNAVLAAIPHSRPWGERLAGMVLEVLATVGRGALDALPGLVFVVVIVLIARTVTRTGALFLDRVRDEGQTYGWLDKDTATPTRMIFTLLVWLFALAMAYPYIPGSQSQAFQGVSVLAGLMVSLGASGTVGQAASGIILMYTRAFRVGEFVRVGETEGTVAEIGLFVTRVRTGLGEEVMLPNSVVLASSSKNYSRAAPGRGFVLDTTVSIGYDTPWRQVQAMLVEAARRTPDILADPAPRVVQTALQDFYAAYRLVAYARSEGATRRTETISQLNASIQDVFNEYGVQIMSPHYLADPPEPKVVPPERWHEKPAPPPP